MFTWRSLSAPSKVIAFIITIVAVWATFYLTNKYVYGSITIIVSPSKSYVREIDDEVEYPSPHTYRLKPGNHEFETYSNGYLDKTTTFKVYPFWHVKRRVVMVPDLTYENEFFSISYDQNKKRYLIVPKIAYSGDVSPKLQLSDEWNDYEAFAKKALSYIKSKGVDPKTLPIDWWAREWWPKGKTIQY